MKYTYRAIKKEEIEKLSFDNFFNQLKVELGYEARGEESRAVLQIDQENDRYFLFGYGFAIENPNHEVRELIQDVIKNGTEIK